MDQSLPSFCSLIFGFIIILLGVVKRLKEDEAVKEITSRSQNSSRKMKLEKERPRESDVSFVAIVSFRELTQESGSQICAQNFDIL